MSDAVNGSGRPQLHHGRASGAFLADKRRLAPGADRRLGRFSSNAGKAEEAPKRPHHAGGNPEDSDDQPNGPEIADGHEAGKERMDNAAKEVSGKMNGHSASKRSNQATSRL